MKSLSAVLLTLCIGIALAAENAALAQMASVKGKVLEVRDVETYTYLRLKTRDGEIWAAVAKTPVKKDSEVTIENVLVMNGFESKAMKKKFDKILFGTLGGAGAARAGGDMAALHSGTAKAADVGDVKVAKAAGPDARTVAEIVTRRAEFKDKTIVVRGKIVKFTSGVLDRNWIHLRDGSGSASDNTHDLVVTTKEQARIGDVVIVKGVVHTDKDLGSGYSYKVLVEDATIRK